MAKASAQKFIGRNRAPRVQIEYDVHIGDAEVKVDLPFVMGVMADLSGKVDPNAPVPLAHQTARGEIKDRKFLEIDVDNFDARMKAMKPRVAFNVPNYLTTAEGEEPKENIAVDVTFENMDDFSPAAVARKVDGVRQVLEARTQLSNLLTYMDGKSGAEKLLADILANPALLQSLASAPKPGTNAGGTEGEATQTEESSNG